MPRREPRKVLRRAWLALAAALAALSGCTLDQFPQSAIHPRSDVARWLQAILDQQVFWVVVIFVLVLGAQLYIILRFRSRPGAPEPKHVHGHTALEIAWTIAPAIILTLIAVPTVVTIYRTQAPPPPGSLAVKVVGHQWWWEFQYPDLGIVTAGEMHVPVGRPVAVSIETADVVHSFWFPAMGGKRDAIPNRTNHIFFTADTTGTFPGQCAELCGVSHANMRMKLVVSDPAQFDAWAAAQKAPPAEPAAGTPAAQGKQLFVQSACIACHTINGVSAGVIGPNLTHFGSRSALAGAMYPNDESHLGRWLSDPPAVKPGSLMPKLGLSSDQVAVLVAYLQSLK